LRRLTRSDKAPASGVITIVGASAKKPIVPVTVVEPDNRYASHISAVDCIHEPSCETAWPMK
jgi:hypothetical protein